MYNNVKKKIAWIMSVIMLLMVVSNNNAIKVKADNNNGDIDVQITNAGNGILKYRIGENGEWLDMPGPQLRASDELNGVTNGTKIYFKAVPNQGMNLDMGNLVNGQQISKDELLAGNVYIEYNTAECFDVQIEFANGGNGGNGGNYNGPTIDVPVQLIDDETITGMITIDNMPVQGDMATIPQVAENGKRVVAISMNDISYTIGKVVINGVVFEEDAVPPEDMGWFYFEVDDANHFDIEVYRGEKSLITMIWAYDKDSDYCQGDDTLVEHGKVEIVSITRELPGLGKVAIYEAGDEMAEVDTSNEGGYVILEKGDDVIVKVIPDYGYQLKSATINDMELIAQEGVSTFELQNIQGNLHFSGAFVETSDIITDNSDIVSKVSLADGGNAVSSGNLSLTVEDNKTYNKDVTSIVNGDATAIASLDFTLDNVVSKGNGTNWVNNITEFEKPINVVVALDGVNVAENETVTVVREHDGILEELNVSYDATTNTITVPTNKFSTYTILKVKRNIDNKENISSNNTQVKATTDSNSKAPKTGDNNEMLMWLALAVIALLVSITVLNRKQRID